MMRLLLFLFVFWPTAALAGGIHAGIPVRSVPGIGPARFQTAQLGWTAPVERGGLVRVFVGQTPEAAAQWYDIQRQTVTRPLPPLSMSADQAHGDPTSMVMFLDGNVAVQVRADQGARDLAEALRAAIVDEGAADWPAPPSLRFHPDTNTYTVDAPDAFHISFEGGARISRGQEPLRFSAPPQTVTAWDALGRASVSR
ncbi:MAG: hypothetical protein AAFV53_10845 [Myxococcota bacterium]